MNQYSPEDKEIPYGQCHCGCGGYTNLAPQTDTKAGWVKGEPLKYIRGHASTIPNPVKYFWERVDIGEPDECWEWTASRNRDGYGVCCYDKRGWIAHRFAWQLANEQEIPDGLIIMHTCDNPPCCNPAHLVLGTTAENAADRDAKGRHRAAKGEKCGRAKLSETEVREIRQAYASGEKQAFLAARFGVNQSSISLIISNKTWTE